MWANVAVSEEKSLVLVSLDAMVKDVNKQNANNRCALVSKVRGEIRDSQLSASSEWDANHGTINSGLNFKAQGRRQGAWSARHNDLNQWLEVNFNLQATITEILSQGRSNHNQWVKSYTVSYSNDCLNFFAYRKNGLVKNGPVTLNPAVMVVAAWIILEVTVAFVVKDGLANTANKMSETVCPANKKIFKTKESNRKITD